MAEYNIKKVFRSVGKELLREYFNQKAPGAEIDWESVGTRNVETLFRAYKALPDDVQQMMQGELNELFDIASDRNNGTTLHTIIKQAGLKPPDDFSDWTLPDQTMWLMLHGSEEDKRKLSRFSDIDSIAERFWFPCKLYNGGAGKLDYEDARKRRLETSVSKFIYDLEGRGKLCMLEYFEREDRGEECFFLYLNNHQKMTPQWHGQVCEWLRDPTSYEIVFVYNYARNELRIRAKGLLKEHRVTLCQIWADVMRDARLDDACLKKATYDIDAFKYRENSGLPDELMEDVSELDVSFIDVDLDGKGTHDVQTQRGKRLRQSRPANQSGGVSARHHGRPPDQIPSPAHAEAQIQPCRNGGVLPVADQPVFQGRSHSGLVADNIHEMGSDRRR